MATITITGLTAGGGSYSASYNSASVTETANGIVFVAVQYPAAGPFSVPTKSGLTFSTVGSLDFTASSGTRHVALYAARAGASPSAGAIAIPATSSAHTRWSIFEATGDVASGDLSSVLGTAVTGQRAGSSPPVALTLTLTALQNADSKVVGAFGNYNYSASTPGSGFTEIHDGNQNNAGLQTEYSTNDTTVDATAVSNYTAHAAVAVEIKAAASGGTGSLDGQQGANSCSATGTLAIQGSASVAQDGNTLAAAGQLSVQGSASFAQAGSSVAAAGILVVTGASSATQEPSTVAAAGQLPIAGAATIVQEGNTVAATAQLVSAGYASVDQAANTLVATGSGSAGNTGSADITQVGNSVSGIGGLAIQGAASAWQDDNALSAIGVAPIIGTLAVQLDDTTVSGIGHIYVAATGSATLEQDGNIVTSSGQVALSGGIAIQQGGHSLYAIGQTPIIGTLAVQLADTVLMASARLDLLESAARYVVSADLVTHAAANVQSQSAVANFTQSISAEL